MHHISVQIELQVEFATIIQYSYSTIVLYSRRGPRNNITQKPALTFLDDDEAVLFSKPKQAFRSPKTFSSCYGFFNLFFIYLMEFSSN